MKPAHDAPLCDGRSNRIVPLALAVGLGLAWFAIRIIFLGARPASIEPSAALNFFLLAPVTEELLFRGMLQPSLRKRIAARWGWLTAANVLTSTIFAVIHLVGWSPAHAALVFFPSLVFGVLMDCYGMVLYPLVVHAIYNLNVLLQ